MKRLLLLCAALFALAACSDNGAQEPEPNTLTVRRDGRVVLTDTGVEWRVALTGGRLDIYLDKTRFIEGMPLLDMALFDVPHGTAGDGTLTIDLRDIVPRCVMPGTATGTYVPQERYRMTSVEGRIRPEESMALRFDCVGYEVDYKGTL